VPSTIRFTLNELPDEPYPQEIWDKKVDAVWGVHLRQQPHARTDMR
jgi:type I restriction enzyme R subunit